MGCAFNTPGKRSISSSLHLPFFLLIPARPPPSIVSRNGERPTGAASFGLAFRRHSCQPPSMMLYLDQG